LRKLDLNGFNPIFRCLCVFCLLLFALFVYIVFEERLMEINFTRSAKSGLKRCPADVRSQIWDNLDEIAKNPTGHSVPVVKLTNRPGLRFTVGKFRVIFEEDGTILDVLDIRNRGDVYKQRR
jgi:mRNA interferase RelE/StbE